MKKYLILFGITVFSFLLSSYLSDNLFLANSPKVNPFYIRNLSMQMKRTANSIAKTFTINKKPAEEFANSTNPQEIPTALFSPVTKGVSAYENENGDLSVKIEDEVKDVTVREVEINGEKIEFIDLTGEQ